MTLPTTTWNHGYTFVAVLTSGLVSVLAVIASIMLLCSERVFSDFDAELPAGFMFFSNLGTGGIAAVWLGFLAVVGGMFLCERERVAVPVVLVAGGVSCLYFIAMLLSCLSIWRNILWAVM
jgi:hypothetical protein